MPYTPILGTLAYVLDVEAQRVLLVHRNARSDDQHLGKWNGLGGKVEDHEDIAASVRRELMEEAGIEVAAMSLRGTVSWPGFGPNGEDWFGFVFLVTSWVGEPLRSNPEGDLHWIDVERLLRACSDDERKRSTADLPMWEGDRHFLPMIFDADPRAFHGVMPYEGGQPVSWSVERW